MSSFKALFRKLKSFIEFFLAFAFAIFIALCLILAYLANYVCVSTTTSSAAVGLISRVIATYGATIKSRVLHSPCGLIIETLCARLTDESTINRLHVVHLIRFEACFEFRNSSWSFTRSITSSMLLVLNYTISHNLFPHPFPDKTFTKKF